MVNTNAFEQLESRAYKDGIDVVFYDFDSEKIKGLYCDGVVGINRNIQTFSEKACVLAEELGHHYTTYGNIIEQESVSDRKQEQHARLWAYNEQIGLLGIVKCFEHGCQSRYEMAEYLNVTEDFLEDAIKKYRQKYGMYTTLDNYIIYFEPCLAVMKIK